MHLFTDLLFSSIVLKLKEKDDKQPRWQIMLSFVHSRSPKLYRSFYIPFLSRRRNVFVDYNILKTKRRKPKKKVNPWFEWVYGVKWSYMPEENGWWRPRKYHQRWKQMKWPPIQILLLEGTCFNFHYCGTAAWGYLKKKGGNIKYCIR